MTSGSDITIHYSDLEDRFWVRDGDDICWFDNPLEAKEGVRAIETREAVMAERNKIAAWLRSLDREGGEINRFLPTTLANWIDEGMHVL